MSTQRRRVLEDTKIHDGVYIEGLDGRAYTVDNWKGGNDANSIIVASGDVKFRMALTEPSSTMTMSSSWNDPLENYMTALGYSEAMADYNGAGNTANIMKMQSSTSYVAGYCNAFTFPDGSTKGFLPSLGQLNLAYQNKAAVDAALRKCGGTALSPDSYFYWSSTFWGLSSFNGRACWTFDWSDGIGYHTYLNGSNYVRPFANIS